VNLASRHHIAIAVAAYLVGQLLAVDAASAQMTSCEFRRGQQPSVVQGRDGNWGVLAAATGCQATLPAGGRDNFSFTSLTVVRTAANGSLRASGNNRFVYVPRAGARSDSFVLRLCGRSNLGTGCANVSYDVTVR
jgi:hypothetical protein